VGSLRYRLPDGERRRLQPVCFQCLKRHITCLFLERHFPFCCVQLKKISGKKSIFNTTKKV
jgi:hypothetical protein